MQFMKSDYTKIEPSLILEQLRRLLDSTEIRDSNVLAKFLEFVVTEKIAGRSNEIKEYTIGVKALGRPVNFNPQLDAIVRIHAGRLRRAVTYYYQQYGKDDSLIISIPKGTYVPEFEYWKVPQPKASAEITHPVVTVDHHPILNFKRHKPRLAVLPFHNLSENNSQDFFVNGLGEQLNTSLARFQNISVISYFSTHRYTSALSDLQKLKISLDINYVLTGSVRFLNDQVKIGMQLIHTLNGKILWAESYSRIMKARNIFDIQEEILGQVLNVLADEKGLLQDIHYTHFDFIQEYNTERLNQLLLEMENDLEAEPGNALLTASLSGLYLNTYLRNLKDEPDLLLKANQLARSSLQIDPGGIYGYRVLAWTQLLAGKKESAIEAFEQCMRLNPKAARMLSAVGFGFICLGEYDRGFSLIVEAGHLLASIPVSSRLGFALYYYQKENFAETLKWTERLMQLDFPLVHLLDTAAHGKIHKSNSRKCSEAIQSLAPHAGSFLHRIIRDGSLARGMLDGLKLAGMKLK
jgi:TolB-like protein